eukprot:5128088-Prymnesium_polylepis.1
MKGVVGAWLSMCAMPEDGGFVDSAGSEGSRSSGPCSMDRTSAVVALLPGLRRASRARAHHRCLSSVPFPARRSWSRGRMNSAKVGASCASFQIGAVLWWVHSATLRLRLRITDVSCVFAGEGSVVGERLWLRALSACRWCRSCGTSDMRAQ